MHSLSAPFPSNHLFQPFYVLSNRYFAITDDSQKKEDNKKSEHINLKVTGQDGRVVHFKIKKNTPLRKLMGAYCNRDGIQIGVVRFRFDGNPINDEDTPSMLEMEDGDSIDVFQQQTGGSNWNKIQIFHNLSTYKGCLRGWLCVSPLQETCYHWLLYSYHYVENKITTINYHLYGRMNRQLNNLWEDVKMICCIIPF